MKNTSELIFVIVPFYNEEKLIGSLVETFKKQTDQVFHVIYVNNNSTDTTVSVLQEAQKQSRFSYEIIEEKIKGTGSASDAGFRYAINTYGAVYLARTDADCLPDFKWVHSIRENLILDKLEFIAGIIKPRTDDVPLTYFGGLVIMCMVFIAEYYGKFKNGITGYKYIFFLVAGNNIAITANMYLLSGGFPHSSIDTTDEDLVLAQSVRKLTKKARQCKDMVVYNSIRRVQAYGYWNTLMWYKERTYKPDIIDIR